MGVSGGLRKKIIPFDFLTISSTSLNISVSRNDQMVPLPAECHILCKVSDELLNGL